MLARERDFCLHFSAERDLFIRRGMGRETFSFARLVGGNEWKSVQPAVASSDVIDVLCCAMRKSNRNFPPPLAEPRLVMTAQTGRVVGRGMKTARRARANIWLRQLVGNLFTSPAFVVLAALRFCF